MNYEVSRSIYNMQTSRVYAQQKLVAFYNHIQHKMYGMTTPYSKKATHPSIHHLFNSFCSLA